MLTPDFPHAFYVKETCGSEGGHCQNVSSLAGGVAGPLGGLEAVEGWSLGVAGISQVPCSDSVRLACLEGTAS